MTITEKYYSVNYNLDDDKTNTEMWYGNHCKIIVTNDDVKLIDKHKIQRLLIGFTLRCLLTGAGKERKSLSCNLSKCLWLLMGMSAYKNVKMQSLYGSLTGFRTRCLY